MDKNHEVFHIYKLSLPSSIPPGIRKRDSVGTGLELGSP